MMHKKKDHRIEYDVAVIGGGPAGLMSAYVAAMAGKRVIVLEKNPSMGKKLLITGNGRCNLTNYETDIDRLVQKYGKKGRFLYTGFSIFGPEQTLEFFRKAGLKTKTERGKRVFPDSDRAEDVLLSLTSGLKLDRVTLKLSSPVKKLFTDNSRITGIEIQGNISVKARNYIIATGGCSYPETGSTGDGYYWAKHIGHRINEPRPSIVPLKTREQWVRELSGLSLKNVALTAFCGEKKILERFGEMLVTHFGISGPIVMDCSKYLLENLDKKEVKVFIDLKPALDHKKLDNRLQRDFLKHRGKNVSNGLKDLLPSSLVPIILKTSTIDPEIQVDQISRSQRKKILSTIKALPLTISGSLGHKWSIVTNGGVELSEIEPSSMRSRIMDNLFFAGEVLDLDGPTGGFNLQVCWTTGYLAGKNASSSDLF